jgi:hypothetical protein
MWYTKRYDSLLKMDTLRREIIVRKLDKYPELELWLAKYDSGKRDINIIGDGDCNTIKYDTEVCIIVDGSNNVIEDESKDCTVFNGSNNIIESNCEGCTITDGNRNTIRSHVKNSRIHNCDDIILDQDNTLVTRNDKGEVVYSRM